MVYNINQAGLRHMKSKPSCPHCSFASGKSSTGPHGGGVHPKIKAVSFFPRKARAAVRGKCSYWRRDRDTCQYSSQSSLPVGWHCGLELLGEASVVR